MLRAGLPFCLALPLLLAACATPAPRKPPPQPSRIEVQPQPRPQWQAVPAKADGAVVPGGRRHIVKPGETGIAIARAYGVPWGRIAEANQIARDAILRVGQPLFIPTGAPATAQRPATRPARPLTPEERASQFRVDVDDLITGSAEAQRAAAPTVAPSATPAPRPTAPAQAAAIPTLSWPVDGRVILSGFGPKAGGRVNDGINIKTLPGATVRAAADGQVIYVGDAISGFGLMLLVRHGPPGPNAVVTAYGHLEDALVARGQQVTRGQPIARAGRSGAVSEPQLLFQVRQGRRAVDPRPLLRG